MTFLWQDQKKNKVKIVLVDSFTDDYQLPQNWCADNFYLVGICAPLISIAAPGAGSKS